MVSNGLVGAPQTVRQQVFNRRETGIPVIQVVPRTITVRPELI